MNIPKRILSKLGVDKAISYSVFTRFFQSFGGVILIFSIVRYLSEIEQGYYYTFGSVLAIQVFFELGLSSVITQYVAHEKSKLTLVNKCSFIGSEEALSRVASLLHFTVKWFSVISVLMFLGLTMYGFYFFKTFDNSHIDVNWQIPWLILAFTTSISLFFSPILAFFEGLGMIVDVVQMRMLQYLFQLFFTIILLHFGFKLYSVPIAAIISILIIPIWIILSGKIILLNFIWQQLGDFRVNYKLEIFPYQWKIALSWISGFFIFQFFNAVVFSTQGAIIAGKMGITLVILNSIMSLSFSWISTKVSVFSIMIANKQYLELNQLFNRTLIQSSILNLLLLVLMYSVIFILRTYKFEIYGERLGDRFLDFIPLFCMMVPVFLNHLISSWAVYLRCHKKEPMLLQSLVIGLLCMVSSIYFGNRFGIIGISTSYMVITLFSCMWAYFIFVNKKRLWHNE